MEGAQLNMGWTMNIAGNWYFIVTLLVIYLPVIWYVTDKIIEPRLGKWTPVEEGQNTFSAEGAPLTEGERKGLRRAGYAFCNMLSSSTER